MRRFLKVLMADECFSALQLWAANLSCETTGTWVFRKNSNQKKFIFTLLRLSSYSVWTWAEVQTEHLNIWIIWDLFLQRYYISLSVKTNIYVCVYISVYLRRYIYIYKYIYTYMYITRMCVCICICIYMDVYIYVCIYMYVYTWERKSLGF